YDVLPLSFRLIVFDTSLLVKKSLMTLIQNAPLWDSKTSTFAGLLTTSDYINVIQYYWQNPEAMSRIDQFRLDSLRDIEKAIGVAPLETVSIHPLRPLYEACRRMLESRARRIPLVDIDDETKRAMVVSVVTQYRILKFVAVNVTETQFLRKPLKHLNLGTYKNLEIARMETPVIEVIHQLVQHNISSVPILNSDGVVVNVFEAVDVITLIKGGTYEGLNLNVGEALQKRSEDFPGIYTCSIDDRLDTLFDTIRKSRVHRFVVIDEQNRLVGMISLSDILEYILLEGEGDDSRLDITISIAMRTSKSFASFGRSAVSAESDSSGHLRRRSSLDKFVIPGRTRLPSARVPVPTLLDLQLTQCLLSSKSSQTLRPRSSNREEESTTIARRQESSESTLLDYEDSVTGSQQSLYYEKMAPFETLRACDYSHSEFLETPSKFRFYSVPTHIAEFNCQATASGVLAYGEVVKSKVKEAAREQYNADNLRHRLSTRSLKTKFHGKSNVSSIPSIPVEPSAQTVKEMCRLGGIRVLTLAEDLAFDSLALPECIQSTAKYIYQHGQNTPRIFELPGRLRTANIIYNRFVKPFKMEDKSGNDEATVGSNLLPTDIDYTVHEIATVFMRLIRRLPGGLLGLPLLETFDDIIAKMDMRADPDGAHRFKPRKAAVLIALATMCEPSLERIALIWAVLGLAAAVGNATEEAMIRGSTAKLTDYKALGYIFGPLFLGEAYEASIQDLGEAIRQRERASHVARVLISNWREIVNAHRGAFRW
ncbi:MAG: hypothetical protein Q9187_007666, partial [Circinaria calcarea]